MAGDSKISQIIADAVVRKNGTDKIIGIAEVSLPEINNKSETMSVMGTLGEINAIVKGHMEAMEATIKFNNITRNINLIDQYPDLNIKAINQVLNPETSQPEDQEIEVVLRGTRSGNNYGTIAKGTKAESEIKMSVTYFELIIDGETIDKIDVLNYIWINNGVDLLASARSMLGI